MLHKLIQEKGIEYQTYEPLEQLGFKAGWYHKLVFFMTRNLALAWLLNSWWELQYVCRLIIAMLNYTFDSFLFFSFLAMSQTVHYIVFLNTVVSSKQQISTIFIPWEFLTVIGFEKHLYTEFLKEDMYNWVSFFLQDFLVRGI